MFGILALGGGFSASSARGRRTDERGATDAARRGHRRAHVGSHRGGLGAPRHLRRGGGEGIGGSRGDGRGPRRHPPGGGCRSRARGGAGRLRQAPDHPGGPGHHPDRPLGPEDPPGGQSPGRDLRRAQRQRRSGRPGDRVALPRAARAPQPPRGRARGDLPRRGPRHPPGRATERHSLGERHRRGRRRSLRPALRSPGGRRHPRLRLPDSPPDRAIGGAAALRLRQRRQPRDPPLRRHRRGRGRPGDLQGPADRADRGRLGGRRHPRPRAPRARLDGRGGDQQRLRSTAGADQRSGDRVGRGARPGRADLRGAPDAPQGSAAPLGLPPGHPPRRAPPAERAPADGAPGQGVRAAPGAGRRDRPPGGGDGLLRHPPRGPGPFAASSRAGVGRPHSPRDRAAPPGHRGDQHRRRPGRRRRDPQARSAQGSGGGGPEGVGGLAGDQLGPRSRGGAGRTSDREHPVAARGRPGSGRQ